jgi:hypothetical protein
MIAWHGPGAKLDVEGKAQGDQVKLGLDQGLFKPTLSVFCLEENPETQPSPIKGWEGDPVAARHFSPSSTRALEFLRDPHLRLDPIYALAVNTTIVITPSIKSDKQDVGHYPTRGPNLGKTCVSLCRLIAVEFVGSHMHSMIRKPSSMGIAGVEPHQYMFLVNRGAVSWRSCQQLLIAKSTLDSEYIASANVANEDVWLQKLIIELGVVPGMHDLVHIHCDDTVVIANAKELRVHFVEKPRL